jgi:D-glycero-D-manno-heptose 1,7-bisphosphate phosphatase
MKNRAVFLDRDGTINVDVGYPSRVGQIQIYPSSFEAVRRIKAAGFLAVIVTNQSGIGRGFLTEADLAEIHRYVRAEFAARDIHLDGIYHCPHFELAADPAYRKSCSCRKPETGMALRAAADLDIDLRRSYMVGDKVEDMLFGINIGAVPVLVRTGYGTASEKALKERGIEVGAVADDLSGAVDWILGRDAAER